MTTPSNTVTTLTDVIKTAYFQSALFAYRAKNIFRATADVQWDESSAPQRGNPVTFTLINALAVATSAISETADPSPVALGDTQKSVTLVEYGNSTQTTKKAKMTSLLDVRPIEIHEITANMEESVDLVARAVLTAGTNVLRPGGLAKANLLATSNLTAALSRQVVANLQNTNTPNPPGMDPCYAAYIHPFVAFDLLQETGQNAWSAPLTYEADATIFRGELGQFADCRWISNANCQNDADAGSGGTVDVYHTLFVGMQFLGEAVGEPQHVIIAGPFDNLQRFVAVSWYGLLGFGRIRENSGWRIEAASSIGAN